MVVSLYILRVTVVSEHIDNFLYTSCTNHIEKTCGIHALHKHPTVQVHLRAIMKAISI